MISDSGLACLASWSWGMECGKLNKERTLQTAAQELSAAAEATAKEVTCGTQTDEPLSDGDTR